MFVVYTIIFIFIFEFVSFPNPPTVHLGVTWDAIVTVYDTHSFIIANNLVTWSIGERTNFILRNINSTPAIWKVTMTSRINRQAISWHLRTKPSCFYLSVLSLGASSIRTAPIDRMAQSDYTNLISSVSRTNISRRDSRKCVGQWGDLSRLEERDVGAGGVCVVLITINPIGVRRVKPNANRWRCRLSSQAIISVDSCGSRNQALTEHSSIKVRRTS